MGVDVRVESIRTHRDTKSHQEEPREVSHQEEILRTLLNGRQHIYRWIQEGKVYPESERLF